MKKTGKASPKILTPFDKIWLTNQFNELNRDHAVIIRSQTNQFNDLNRDHVIILKKLDDLHEEHLLILNKIDAITPKAASLGITFGEPTNKKGE